MRMILTLAEIVVAFLLIGVIILQAKGTGLGSSWGGSGETYTSRQGVEKIIFRVTIILSFLFGVLALISVLAK